MRMILLSALLGLGIGLFGTVGANAAPLGPGFNDGAVNATLLQDVRHRRWRRWDRGYRRCRTVTVCRRGPYGRRCRVERICRW